MRARSDYDWPDDEGTEVDSINPYEFDDDVPETLTSLYDGKRSFTRQLRPGSILGEYRIERVLRDGAMGRVYAAIQPEIGRRVAIKMLHAEVGNVDVVARFIDEARAVNRIAHPNVIDIFTLGRAGDGSVYLVMELLAGESLAERIARGPLAPAETRSILHQLACALDAVHARGIVHRDVKPANVFLVHRTGALPLVKLLDFGIAKLHDRVEQGFVVGTPRYIAPEQARGLPVDHRADIYALGGVAFELVTGRTAFLGESTVDVVAQQISVVPPRPSQLVPDVAADLDDIVFAMLAKRPGDRPPLAALRAVIDALDAGDRERSASSTADLPVMQTFRIGTRIATRSRRRRGTFAGVAAVLAAAAVLAFVQLQPRAAGGALVAAPVPSEPTPVAKAATPAPAPAPAPIVPSPAIAVRDKHAPIARRARVVQPRTAPVANATAPPIAAEPLVEAPPPPPQAPQSDEPEPVWAHSP